MGNGQWFCSDASGRVSWTLQWIESKLRIEVHRLYEFILKLMDLTYDDYLILKSAAHETEEVWEIRFVQS